MLGHCSDTTAREFRQMLPQGQKLCAQTVTATFKHTQNARILCLLMGSDGSGGQNKDSMIQTGWISKIPACESPSFQTLGLNMWNLRLFFLDIICKTPWKRTSFTRRLCYPVRIRRCPTVLSEKFEDQRLTPMGQDPFAGMQVELLVALCRPCVYTATST